MADELISRQAVIKLLRGKCVGKYPSTFIIGLFAAADEINKLPAVDAVEVCRCKDCKHWRVGLDKTNTWCARLNGMETVEHDFCSHGEKRGEENAAD